MDANIITAASYASHKGLIPFPEVIGMLFSAGVEYYHVDYVALQTRYYSNERSVVIVPLPFEDFSVVSVDFDLAELKAAIFDSQNNAQPYRQFSDRAAKAGVQGYFTFLRGQRVVYLGRQGEQHTEWFPGAKPSST